MESSEESVSVITGIGKKTADLLAGIGIHNVKQLSEADIQLLQKPLGQKRALTFQIRARKHLLETQVTPSEEHDREPFVTLTANSISLLEKPTSSLEPNLKSTTTTPITSITKETSSDEATILAKPNSITVKDEVMSPSKTALSNPEHVTDSHDNNNVVMPAKPVSYFLDSHTWHGQKVTLPLVFPDKTYLFHEALVYELCLERGARIVMCCQWLKLKGKRINGKLIPKSSVPKQSSFHPLFILFYNPDTLPELEVSMHPTDFQDIQEELHLPLTELLREVSECRNIRS